MVFFNPICGAIVGLMVSFALSGCWLGPFYGTFLLAGVPTLIFLVFTPRAVFQYCLGLGFSFALISLAKSEPWPIPAYGIIFGAAAFAIRLFLELADYLTEDNLPIKSRSYAPSSENLAQQQIEGAPIIT